MGDPYYDGLDEFDRDVLRHVSLGSQPLNDTHNRPRTLDYFPTPASSRLSNSIDQYGTYYEATLLPSPHLEPEHIRRTMNRKPMILNPRPQRTRPPCLNKHQPAPGSSPRIHSARASQIDTHSSTPVVHGIPLVSLRQALPDKFRAIFPYELLNAVQSKCFKLIYGTNDNVVVAAPTGSGKTAILELAICKLALDRGHENFKIVYQAPTKALCSEKARDWEKKFNYMNLKCAELTGDTSQAEMRRVGDASIIVTTPEKWDSITRKWQDHQRLLQMVELFLIDEVHILKDARGATLEAVVSRMKTIGANVRFIALSATVPNSDDIARWLGRNHTNQQIPAHREAFGEEFRPVKLQKFVYGFDSGANDFIFDKFLDQKLPGLISKHARQKPILVFCFTRKSCESTAALLAEFASGRPDGDKSWPVPSQRVPVVSRELQEIVKFGVAFHHAGLDVQDRTAVEQNFLKGQLGVICCTSTLAVGVNLPCHTVVLKGTVGFTDDKLDEYSDLEVMQMLGRAGRPQFDDSATAIILTRAANKNRYQKMVSGQETLESTLHLNLIEHLNSEVCLGTIHDLTSAKTWLAGTFLSVRLRRNPNYYHLTGTITNPSQIDDKLEEICERDITKLQEAELLTDHSTIRCTEYGRAMSKYMVAFDTMKLLLTIPRAVGMEGLITILSQASEFKEFRFKPAERALFREINQSPLIMYPIREAVAQAHHKVSLMVQAQLGCVQYPDSGDAAKLRRQVMMERKLVFERLNRLVRAVIDCKGFDRDSVGTKTALELARSLAAESWEGRATQLTQVPNIGPVGMRKLASKDIRSVVELANKEYDEIERLMSRQPPFGKKLQESLDKFPRLAVEAVVVNHRVQPRAEEPVLVEVKVTLRYLNRKGPPNWLGRVPALNFLAETSTGTLVYFWRGSMRKLDKQAGFELKFSVGLRHAEEQIICHFSCEEIVGTITSKTLEHKVPASAFPVRPAVLEANSQGNLEEEEEYLYDDGFDESDLILVADEAATRPAQKLAAMPVPEPEIDDYPSVDELIEMASSPTKTNLGRDKFDNHLAGHEDEDEINSTQAAMREPVQLPNGRWQCNHICSGGAQTRSGKPCTHKCCREGLDKPRKRPVQRPKRKRDEEDSVDVPALFQSPPQQRAQKVSNPPSASQAKRPKVQAMPAWTQTKLTQPSNGPAKPPKKDWQKVDFDAMDLECIDLSFTDDEDDFFSLPDDFPSMEMAGRTNSTTNCVGTKSQRTSTYHGEIASTNNFNPPRCPPTGLKNHLPVKPTPAQRDSHHIDYFENDDFSFLDKAPSTQRLTEPASSSNAFKSGASDKALFQGLSNQFTGNDSNSPRQEVSKVATAVMRHVEKPSEPSSSLFLDDDDEDDDIFDMTPDNNTSPATHSVLEPVSSNTLNDSADASQSEKKASTDRGKGANEPAWVAEFDPDLPVLFYSQLLSLASTLGATFAPPTPPSPPSAPSKVSSARPQVIGMSIIHDLFFFHERARKVNIWAASFLSQRICWTVCRGMLR
ncbi:ATP-dependent DNA helicase MER3 [Collariella sp. IMI 366227]|nr:ATP-dependent DNA helicase MER3 [Collariella sp. IMI 366227]